MAKEKIKHFPGEVFTEIIDGEQVRQYINTYGIKIRQRCSTCKHGQLCSGRSGTELECKCKICGDTRMPREACCRAWEPNKTAQNAGNAAKNVKVKSQEYIAWYAENHNRVETMFSEMSISDRANTNIADLARNLYTQEQGKSIYDGE